jgi:hypothetical protein
LLQRACSSDQASFSRVMVEADSPPASFPSSAIARELAEAAAAAALPEQFQGNALALLQAVYRDP